MMIASGASDSNNDSAIMDMINDTKAQFTTSEEENVNLLEEDVVIKQQEKETIPRRCERNPIINICTFCSLSSIKYYLVNVGSTIVQNTCFAGDSPVDIDKIRINSMD